MSDAPIPDLPAAPPRDGGLLSRLQPLLTLVIAIVAIALATWEGLENRRHNRLSVLPRLGADIESGGDSTSEFARMTVESTGLGPVVINTFRVYFDGALQDSSVANGTTRWHNVIAALTADGTSVSAQAYGSGYYIPTGRSHVLFEARRPRSDSTSAAPLSGILSRLAVQICYCSVYGTDCDEVVLTTAALQPQRCNGP